MKPVNSVEIKQWTKIFTEEMGFDQAAWIPLKEPATIAKYDEWLARGWAGEMHYLRRHRDQKADPKSLLTASSTPKNSAVAHSSNSGQVFSGGASSVTASLIVVTKSYVPAPKAHDQLPGLRMASYARNEDYHDWLKADLDHLAHRLSLEFPDALFRPATDSAPVLERDHAVQAGLGWWGKNTCVIHPQQGSLFFIGEIITTIPVATEEMMQPQGSPAAPDRCDSHSHPSKSHSLFTPLPDFCGTCTRCIDTCPTGAIEAPRELNATKCISYWTIEAKGVPPENLRSQFGDWFFGCDLCQTVCPWNQKVFRGREEPAMATELFLSDSAGSTSQSTIEELRFILTASDDEIKLRLKKTALSRAKPFGLRRNALIVAANRKIFVLKEEIKKYAHSSDDALSELARWTLGQIESTGG